MENKLKIIFGEDVGFGDEKTSQRNDDGKIKSKKKSSVVAEASLEATDMPFFEGKRYYIGDDALVADSKAIMSLESYENLEKVSPIFVWKLLQDNNLEAEDVDMIVLGLSFAHIDNAAKYIKRVSKFKINNKTYDLTGKIMLVPQGVGAKYTIEKFYTDVPSNYLIIDIGFLTLDTVDVINNTVRPENVKGEQGLGLIKVARNIQEYIAENYSEYISIKEAKEILTEKKYFLSGKEYDLKEVIDDFSRKYTKSIMNFLEERHAREFKKYRKIYFVGGGAHFIRKTSDIIEILKKPEYANSIGNLLKGEEELSKK